MTGRRYFTEQDASLLTGRRVQARVAIIRAGRLLTTTRTVAAGITLAAGARGTVVARIATDAEYLVAVRWGECWPIDWYTEDEFRSLLEAAVEEAA